MKNKNLTGPEIADMLGVTYKYVNRLINGSGRASDPKYETVANLASALEVDVTAITKGG